MSRIVKIKLNRAGVRRLLKSDEMQELLTERAQEIADRCGAGYKTDSYVGQNRANARVWPETAKARQDNHRNNTLEKALG